MKVAYNSKKIVMHPLLSWDIIVEQRMNNASQKDMKSLLELKKRFGWNINFNALFKNRYEAIVVTDIDERICWINKGFELMTGYKSSFAKNKKPNFLQGANTDPEIKKRIKTAIHRRQAISETLINYRKDGTAYRCRVEITPVYTFENTLTHFIALESNADDE
jgi:PAS domain S-box-containing protein